MNDLQVNDLFGFDPFERNLRALFRPSRWATREDAPQIRLDVSESGGDYVVNAEIPGVRKEDIDVRIDGRQVTISAEVKREKEEKKGDRVLRCERQYGYASRSFTLDAAVDEGRASAKYDSGVLRLTLPKKAVSEHKRLPIG